MAVNFNSTFRCNSFLLEISSKNKKSVDNFSFFFFKSIKNYSHLIKLFPLKKNIQKLTILKSPHVNKTAQEQFEFREISKKFFIHSKSIILSLIVIKKISNRLFNDIKIDISLNLKVPEKKLFNIFDFHNFKMIQKDKYFNQSLKKKKLRQQNNFDRVKKRKIINLNFFFKFTSLKSEILTIKQ